MLSTCLSGAHLCPQLRNGISSMSLLGQLWHAITLCSLRCAFGKSSVATLVLCFEFQIAVCRLAFVVCHAHEHSGALLLAVIRRLQSHSRCWVVRRHSRHSPPLRSLFATNFICLQVSTAIRCVFRVRRLLRRVRVEGQIVGDCTPMSVTRLLPARRQRQSGRLLDCRSIAQFLKLTDSWTFCCPTLLFVRVIRWLPLPFLLFFNYSYLLFSLYYSLIVVRSSYSFSVVCFCKSTPVCWIYSPSLLFRCVYSNTTIVCHVVFFVMYSLISLHHSCFIFLFCRSIAFRYSRRSP